MVHSRDGPAPDAGMAIADRDMVDPIVVVVVTQKAGDAEIALKGLSQEDLKGFLRQLHEAKIEAQALTERLVVATEKLAQAATQDGFVTRPRQSFWRSLWRTWRWWWTVVIIPALIAAVFVMIQSGTFTWLWSLT